MGWRIGWLLAGLGCRAEELPFDPSPAAELARAVMPGTVVIQDPWLDGASLTPPVVTDLDGDGWLDLVGGQAALCLSDCERASATYVNAVVAVWPGGPGGFPPAPTFEAWAPDPYRDVFPSAAVGDTNGDGVAEVLFADAVASNGRHEEGKLWLAEGAAGALGPITWTMEGGIRDLHLGEAAQALWDVNGDGYDDLLLGLTRSYLPGVDGLAVAFYGRAAGFRATPDWISVGLGRQAGSGLAAGDVDGDGYADAFVGGPEGPNLSGDGQVFGFRGGPGGLARTPDWTLTHAVDPVSPHFGEQILVIPDLNGDGSAELAVASPSFQVGDYSHGKVEVFEGGPTGPASAPTWTFVGPEPTDSLGRGLAVGDLDGDGLTDLLMTVERQWTSAGGAWDGDGGALVALGVPGGLSSTPAYVMRGPHGATLCFDGGGGHGYDWMERAVQVADLDRDGRDDVLFACATQISGTPGWEGSLVVSYGGTDTDADGVTDALDCEPNDPTIHPGADEIGYDGIDEDCAGGDDFDLDADGAQAVPWGFDEDDADEVITSSMTVYGSCVGALGFAVDGVSPGATVEVYEGRYTANGYSEPPGVHPCDHVFPGDGLHLIGPVLLATAVADATGHAVLFGGPALPTACSDRVQALDVSTCTMSTDHTTPP